MGEASIQKTIEHIYRSDSRKVLATLIRLLKDFDLAEDAMQDAFAAAIKQWPKDGVPSNPSAWLISTGRIKAIDRIRRRSRFNDTLAEIADEIEASHERFEVWDENEMEDDRLRLIFTCCHPALPGHAMIALTLREVCGLTTEEIARAFLTTPPTLAQRIVRAKRKIRDAGIPYEVPARHELADRLDSVLQVVYLVYKEGYYATAGDALTRPDLSGEAIHLGRMLYDLLPQPEVVGLLGLMLLQESRRDARTSPDGDIVLLGDQDRSLWNRELIEEGTRLVEQALSGPEIGAFTLQAAIAALHADAKDAGATDWVEIVALYDLLMQATPSPVIELNRAVAVAMRDGAEAGLRIIDELLDRGELQDYHLAFAARADLCRQLGRRSDAADAYRRALQLAQQEPERRFLMKRLDELQA